MRTVSIYRSDNGAVSVVVNGGTPRTLINPTNITIRELPENSGVIIKKSDESWRQTLEQDDEITINRSPAPTVVADLIEVLTNNVFAGETEWTEPDKLAQIITFGALADRPATDDPFELEGTASSGLTVAYASSDDLVFTIAGNVLTPVGAGTANVTATQAGNDWYAAATPVDQPLTLT